MSAAALEDRLLEALRAAVGDAHVELGEAAQELSRDLSFAPLQSAAAVVAPASAADTAAVIALAAAAGTPVVPRGGGMSYTGGYQPAVAGALLIDTRRLDRIREINVEDLTVTVEAGVTWERLYEALRAEGVRTPCFGPISGRYATVGGSLSQGTIFYGSAKYGTLADSTLGVEAVLADGTLVHTGSWAMTTSTPFFRWAGPDLTGVFLGDCGAFAVKTAAVLRLIEAPRVLRGIAFGYDSLEQALDGLVALGRPQIAAELYGFDPYWHELYVRRGYEFLEGVAWSNHALVEGRDEAEVEAQIEQLRAIGAAGGRELDGRIATETRDDPFGSVSVLGPGGRVWVPIHCLVPLSKARAAARAGERVIESHRAELDRLGVSTSHLTSTVGHFAVIEPCMWWHDEVSGHRWAVSQAGGRTRREQGPNPPARALVQQLKAELADAYRELGAAHLQIGKFYPFEQVLEPGSWSLLSRIKDVLDPAGTVNPGSLGLATGRILHPEHCS